MKFIKMVIHPNQAREWLEKQGPNRFLSNRTVQTYCADMDAGNWLATHQGIAFDEDGKLVDGQHRLAAILKHGKPVEMMVVSGMSRAACLAVDLGRRRDKSDCISISGLSVPRDFVGVSNVFWKLARNNRDLPSVFQTKKIIEKNLTSMRFLERIKGRKYRSLSNVVIFTALVVAHKYMPEVILEDFWKIYTTGKTDNFLTKSSAIVFRNWMLTNASSFFRNEGRRMSPELLSRALFSMENFLKKREIKDCRLPGKPPFDFNPSEFLPTEFIQNEK